MALDLVPGTLCIYDNRIVQIDGMDTFVHAFARDMVSGSLIRLEIAKLRPLPAEPRKQETGYVPEEEWKRCTALARDLTPRFQERQIARRDLEKIASRHGISIRHLQRLRKKLRDDERTSVLVRSAGGRPAGLNMLAPEVHELVCRVISRYFMRRERPTKADLVVRIQSLCRRVGRPQPSRNAVLRRIDAQLGYEADIKRFGRKTAQQKWSPRPGRLRALAPLEIVQIDHTRVDVMVVSEDRQSVLGRPWITLAIDVCTRVVIGMYMSMEAPSSTSVSLCIEHIVLPKPEETEEPGLWPMYGKPNCILVDNGKDLRAQALQRGCEQHGIDLQWRPVRTPHYGAHIERLNGTLMRMCHLLPGTTFSNPRERGDYDSAAHATLTLPELKDWLVQKICRYYHVRSHRGLGVPPAVAWQFAFTDARGVLRPPSMVADPQSFRMDFLPYEFRRVYRTGIELDCSRYWHNDLIELLRSTELSMVRYDPRARQCVWVRLPEGRVVEVPAIAGRAVGDPARRIALDAATAAELDQAIDVHFERCDAIERDAATKTRRARRKPSMKRGKGASAEPVSAPANPKEHASAASAAVSALPKPDAAVAEDCRPSTVPQEAARESQPPVAAQSTVQNAEAAASAGPPPLRVPAVSPLPVEDWA